ncbi:addea7bf-b97e-4690-be8d-70a42029edd7 [Thermothielavioides terrestris]|uniref:Addea7bf-b97e-4690-be8d-70a42029edd7 n=1 Tax=Thermothielavioides terrestris TaxID=2587410 RepID=A0A3S4EY18_9PEZI|nr:addea7bf-b97e-4690-be8d-70a42029edd7 [Thermothielavioides terrestris]
MAAVPSVPHDVGKMSFARIAAASPSKGSKPAATAPVARTPNSVPVQERREDPGSAAAVSSAAAPTTVPASASAGSESPRDVQQTTNSEQVADAKVTTELKDLKLETQPPPNLVVNGSLAGMAERSAKAGNSQTPSDDTSQRADSSSELGTKPPSLDGKSITSGTTFALDEKESLRPDDSASVKAAAEDDDSFSIRGSYIAGSRMGSDLAARMHRIQIGDMPPRALPVHHLPAGNKSQGVGTPQSGISDKQTPADSKAALGGGTATPDGLAPNAFYSQNPDEKLLEAMQSPKDRIFLLRLEQQVIEFVQDSKEPYMDLPPSNSFCRMLTHRLADYYHMTHSYEAAAGAVRIFRTPFCRIPPPLSSIAATTSNSSSPAPVVMPRKIMRRGEDGELGTASAGPSKPTSEAGSDSKEKAAPAKEKLTREEREEAYNKARQRIFGSVEKTDSSNQDGEDGNGGSRASSVSAKDKTNGGKRKTNKQRRDDSESFESRSQYVAWCGPQHPTWGPAAPQYYPVSAAPFNTQFQQPYPNAPQPMYAPGQPYAPQMMPNNGFAPPYGGVPTYPTPPMPQAVPQAVPPPPQQGYRAPNPPLGGPYGSPVPNMAQPTWPPQQGFGQTAYPPRASPVPPAGIPYAYGQLPANANPNDPKSQHPIPGSYNRQAFNPKTQSFVPANGLPMQPPPPPPPPAAGPYGGSSPRHGSPQFQPPHMGYGGFQQQPMPQPGYGPAPGPYGMTRQGSNNSMPPYHAVQAPPHVPPPHGPPQHLPPTGPMHMPNKPGGPSGPGQTFSHLPNYGNPATLPQKPST